MAVMVDCLASDPFSMRLIVLAVMPVNSANSLTPRPKAALAIFSCTGFIFCTLYKYVLTPSAFPLWFGHCTNAAGQKQRGGRK